MNRHARIPDTSFGAQCEKIYMVHQSKFPVEDQDLVELRDESTDGPQTVNSGFN